MAAFSGNIFGDATTCANVATTLNMMVEGYLDKTLVEGRFTSPTTTPTTSPSTTPTTSPTTTETFGSGEVACVYLSGRNGTRQGPKRYVLSPESIHKDDCYVAQRLNSIMQGCDDVSLTVGCGAVVLADGSSVDMLSFTGHGTDVDILSDFNSLLVKIANNTAMHPPTDAVILMEIGNIISLPSEESCTAVANVVNRGLVAWQNKRITGCKIDTTTVTTTTTTTTTTITTTTTPVAFQFMCTPGTARAGVPDDYLYLAVPRDTRCINDQGLGLLDLVNALRTDCSLLPLRMVCDRLRAIMFKGAAPVRGLTSHHVHTMLATSVSSRLPAHSQDLATCKCNGQSASGVGPGAGDAGCTSLYNGRRFCYVDKGACLDGSPLLVLGEGTWEYSYSACETKDVSGGFLAMSPGRCRLVSGLLNTVLHARRDGLMQGCGPLAPTTTTRTTRTTTITVTTTTTTTTTITATTTTTTTTTATTTTTRTACAPGDFYDQGSEECRGCPSGQYGFESVRHFKTVCEGCTTCGKDTYRVKVCSAHQDTVCQTCTVCTADEYQAVACSSFEDTVCKPRTQCRNRCQFVPTMRPEPLCWPANTEVPCTLYTAAQCLLQQPRCRAEQGSPGTGAGTGGVTACVPQNMPGYTFSCERMEDYDTCATMGKHRCTWDAWQNTCRNNRCSDTKDADSCKQTPGCVYDGGSSVCRSQSDAADEAACMLYSGTDIEKCPTSRCTKDIFARYVPHHMLSMHSETTMLLLEQSSTVLLLEQSSTVLLLEQSSTVLLLEQSSTVLLLEQSSTVLFGTLLLFQTAQHLLIPYV